MPCKIAARFRSASGLAGRFQPGDQLVEPQLLQALPDRLELAGGVLDQLAALATQVERLAQAGLSESSRPMISSIRSTAAS